MLDIYFPVNTIYGTFDVNFNPNTAWGGTWVKLTDGRVLIPSATPNVTGGSSTSGSHTLLTTEIPSHNHAVTYNLSAQYPMALLKTYTNLDGNTDNRYYLAVAGSGYNHLMANNTGGGGGHTHGSINPLNRSYCLWYRTA